MMYFAEAQYSAVACARVSRAKFGNCGPTTAVKLRYEEDLMNPPEPVS